MSKVTNLTVTKIKGGFAPKVQVDGVWFIPNGKPTTRKEASLRGRALLANPTISLSDWRPA